ncbi:hypothetical protein AMS62_12425 [Bacillus sp. FJAT-18019]|nr:hypothetical protein AMS62_12425 [Bacillus sp. FJAT-18019]
MQDRAACGLKFHHSKNSFWDLQDQDKACSTKETAVAQDFQKADMIHLKVVNNILDETGFSFR